MENQLKAGFGKVSITPSYPVPLRGYGKSEERFHQSVNEPIYAICIALSDGEEKLLLVSLDLTDLTDEMSLVLHEKIEEKFGIPFQNVLLNTAHNHSSPDLHCTLPCMDTYREEFAENVLTAVSLALQDLSDTALSIGSKRVKGWNFVRQYLLSNGTYGGDNFGDFINNTIIGHETEADDLMQAIRFVRGEKRDIVLVGWQAHPHRVPSSDPSILSADLIGPLRDITEEKCNVLVCFFQCCGGNINSDSRIPEENRSLDYYEVGKGLAEGLCGILNEMRPVKSGEIRSSMKTFVGEVNHAWDHKVKDAETVLEYWKTCSVPRQARLFANSYGFHSVYHAMYVIKRSQMPETLSGKIGAVSFGDVCLVWSPYELHDTTGMYLRDTSPFEMTFALGYTNGFGSYMPTIKGFVHGGYGCDICEFPAGTTEKLTDEMIAEIVKVK
jgi:hypothetical protein